MPRLLNIAGPPGGGRSTAFPGHSFGLDAFNADDRAAEHNGSQSKGISRAIRAAVNVEFEAFVLEKLRAKKRFAFVTTQRTDITLQQTAQAHRKCSVRRTQTARLDIVCLYDGHPGTAHRPTT